MFLQILVEYIVGRSKLRYFGFEIKFQFIRNECFCAFYKRIANKILRKFSFLQIGLEKEIKVFYEAQKRYLCRAISYENCP